MIIITLISFSIKDNGFNFIIKLYGERNGYLDTLLKTFHNLKDFP